MIFKSVFCTKNDKMCPYKPVSGRFRENKIHPGGVKNDLKPSGKLKSLPSAALMWLKNKLHYIFTALFIFAVFMTACAVYGVYPFGENAMASYDMLAQIVPFIEHLFDVFSGKSSLFYSTAIGGGADTFGTMAYCMISPFTWIFLLFGSGNVYYGVSVVLPLKLVVISFSAMHFIEKVYPLTKAPVKITFSLLYAFCGYMFVANTYINWLDLLIYVPFVVLGFKKIISDGKILGFSIAYALMIYTCFSISSFAMILVYMIIFAYALFCRPDDRKTVLFKSCLALLLAVAFALPVMVPSFIAYLNSGRSTGLFANINNELSYSHLYTKFTYVISDVTFVFLTVIYFIKSGVKRPIDRFLLFTGIVLLMPVVIDECCLLLNAGSYLSYSLRFGFLSAFYFFYVALKCFNTYYAGLDVAPVRRLQTKTRKVAPLIVLCVFALAEVVGIIFIDNIIALFTEAFSLSDDFDFYSVFDHSLGGLEVIGPIAIIVAVILSLATAFYKRKILSVKILSVFICIAEVTLIGFYNIALVRGNVTDLSTFKEYQQIVATLSSIDEDGNNYYRIKDTTDALTADAPLTGHANAFSVFSSVVDKRNFTAAQFFNYKGNSLNISKSAKGSLLGDMLLGYKYYFSPLPEDGATNDMGGSGQRYTTLIEETAQENYAAFLNQASLPLAFKVKSGDLNLEGLTYREQLEKIYSFLGGSREICDVYPLTVTDSYDTDVKKLSNGVFKISVRIATPESFWFVETDFPDDYDIYYCRTGTYSKSDAKKLEPGADILYSYWRYTAASYTLTIKDYSGKLTTDDIVNCVKTVGVQYKNIYNPNATDNVTDIANKNKVDYTISSGDRFYITTTADDDESYLFLSYAALEGHEIMLNGRTVSFIDNSLDLMLLKLDKGENVIEIKYTSPYIKYSVYGLIASLLLSFAVYMTLKRKKVRQAFTGVIYYASILLFVAVFGFFIIYPFSVFAVKLFKMLLSSIF